MKNQHLGEIEILATCLNGRDLMSPQGEVLMPERMIELAGRTAYQSTHRITDDSYAEFLKRMIKSGHEAVLEFSWASFVFDLRYDFFINTDIWLVEAFSLDIPLKFVREKHRFIVSGNFRCFRDLLKKMPKPMVYPQQWAIYRYLERYHPLFLDEAIVTKVAKTHHYDAKSFDFFESHGCYESLEKLQYWNTFPLTPQEKMKNSWLAVRMVGSRAFTHQLVRHRLCSFVQESQRFCDERDFFENDYFVIPPRMFETGLDNFYVSQLQEISLMFNKLLEFLKSKGSSKNPKEDARFLLPNAVKSEICVAGNLEQWFRVFDLRLKPDAQWEIRDLCQQIHDQIIALYPEISELYDYFHRQPKYGQPS